MMRSIKTRLITATAIWVVIAVASTAYVLSRAGTALFVEHHYNELHAVLEELELLVQVSEHGTVRVDRPLSDPRFAIPRSGFYWEIQIDCNVKARSASLEGPMLVVPTLVASETLSLRRYRIDGPTGQLLVAERVRWQSDSNEPIHILVGVDERRVDFTLSRLHYPLYSALGGFALMMILASALLLIYALWPFRHLRSGLANFRVGATPDLRGRFPDEVGPLVDDLNALAAASDEQIRQARIRANVIAHGLKTPLAILVDEAHRLERQEEGRSAATILDQCRSMQSQIDYYIASTRSAVSRPKPGTAASLADAAQSVVCALERLHIDRSLTIENEIPQDVMVACESEDLKAMLANLIDNACKHAKMRVVLRLGQDGPGSLIRVLIEDDGPGLPPEAWEDVFKIDGPRPRSSGLGLLIVRDLVEFYCGEVRLDRSELGGLKVLLDLPAFSGPKQAT